MKNKFMSHLQATEVICDWFKYVILLPVILVVYGYGFDIKAYFITCKSKWPAIDTWVHYRYTYHV